MVDIKLSCKKCKETYMEALEPTNKYENNLKDYCDKSGNFIVKTRVYPYEVFMYCDHCGAYRVIRTGNYVNECIASRKPVNQANDNTLWWVISIIIILLNLFFVLPIFL